LEREQLGPTFPSACRPIESGVPIEIVSGRAYRWLIDCSKLEADRFIGVDGMSSASERVIARVRRSDGLTRQAVLTPDEPWIELLADPTPRQVAASYSWLGIEHFATGFDHVLFVLGLILLIGRAAARLIGTVTCFTLAHSITLTAATLDVARVPSALAEVLIAMSVLALAVELVQRERGVATFGAERPWLIAFGFGLLHGFGFAGALRETGLSRGDVPLALLCFNLGIELVQVAFVAIVMLLLWSGRWLRTEFSSTVRWSSIYVIGVLASYWFIDRAQALWA
jgi:hypothetical protein